MKRKKYEWFQNIFAIALFPIAAIIISLIIGSIQDQMGLGKVILGIVVGLVVFVILYLCVYLTIRMIARDIISDSATEIAAKAIEEYEIKRKATSLISEELMSLEQLLQMENSKMIGEYKLTDVLLLSNDLSYDIEASYGLSKRFKDVVVKNAKSGIKYTYCISDNYQNQDYVNMIINEAKVNVVTKILPEKFFFVTSDFDFVIYTGVDKNGMKHYKGYMPITSLVSDYNIDHIIYHMPINKDLCDKLLNEASKI